MSPARILDPGATVEDLVNAFLAGPTAEEVAAGFPAGSPGVKTALDSAVVSGVFVINLRDPQPATLPGSKDARLQLAASLARAKGVDGVSILIGDQPWCSLDDTC